MKISRPFIHSVLAFAIVMLFVQCNKKIIRLKNQLKHLLPKTTSILGKLPIAYVNIDSLLQKYNYAKDLNESLLRRAENSRANVNEKGRQLEKKKWPNSRENIRITHFFLSRTPATGTTTVNEKNNKNCKEYIQRLEDENMREQQKKC